MKMTRAFVLCTLVLGLSMGNAMSSVQVTPAPGEDDQTCVKVYCDGQYGGLSCGATTPDIIEGAIELCNAM
jgi:hypothetical protein